ncbi:MAG: ABC transporter ATP-binding protein [Actinomycetota bacterium]|nr:ABC transporter ATP-binding protein [Actinomycetota bacterium]
MADLAIDCHDVWKSYRIYHQRAHTLKERVLARRNRFDEFWALTGVDLEFPTGSTTGIIGANGSGKSTLLKTMARILTPNRGTVRVSGTISSLLELGIGFHPELTGHENVYLSGSLMGRTKRDMDALYDEIVEFAGIEAFMDSPVKNYSTGMYARLAFALAVSVEPEILLVDEVLAVGDESFAGRCFERMADFRRQGRTIVLVTHALETVRSLCAQAAWLDKGVVKEVGPSHDVVASYLGHVHRDISEQEPDEPIAVSPGDHFGTSEVLLTEMGFYDADGNSVGSFRTDETFVIRIGYRVEKPVKNLSCTFAVYRSDTLAYVFAQNSKAAGLYLDPSGEGTMEVVIPRLPLLRGTYLVSVALHDYDVRRFYDWHERRFSFIVFDNKTSSVEGGTLHVESAWRSTDAHAQHLAYEPAPEAS